MCFAPRGWPMRAAGLLERSLPTPVFERLSSGPIRTKCSGLNVRCKMKHHVVLVDVSVADLQTMPLVAENLEANRRVGPFRRGLIMPNREHNLLQAGLGLRALQDSLE